MERKQMRWWVALMLPGFFLRSLIPVGFMPMVGPRHAVQLVICDSYALVPWTTTSMPIGMSQHHHTDRAANSRGDSPVHQDHGSCPFGSSPALGAQPTFASLPNVVQPPSALAVASPQLGYVKISPRAQSPRGPPA